VTDVLITGRGTAEAEWGAALDPLPPLDLPATGRTVVVAPHPDDETLAVGGLVAMLLAAGREVLVVAVTDGEASHPGVLGLAERRTDEATRALAALGGGSRVRLGLPDGGVDDEGVADALVPLLRGVNWCLAPWEGDGHPDHEATGRGARVAAARTGARLLAYPVWTWHWAMPGDPRVPWHRARRVALDPAAHRRKRAALRCFPSQTTPQHGAPAVVPPEDVAHFLRPYEVVLL
jgi:LmbE family N-acetylglucosaminyl deacetylase